MATEAEYYGNESVVANRLAETIGGFLKEKFEPHVAADWASVELVQHQTQLVAADAEAARDGSMKINIYPSLLQKHERIVHFTLLREFGRLEFAKGSQEAVEIWEKKLALPDRDQIAAVQDKLASKKFSTYHAMVASFSTVVDRLVALNISNALIAHQVPFAEVFNIDLHQWGPTKAYAELQVKHPLAAVLSAYTSHEIWNDYGTAFANFALGVNVVTEGSVRKAFERLMADVANKLR